MKLVPPVPRIACVNLPHLAAAVEARDDAALAGRPFAVVTARDGTDRVQDLSHPAHLAGVARGMTAGQARQLCPELLIRPARPEACRAALGAMLDTLAEFTSVVEPAETERSWLSIAGIVGRGGTEPALTTEIVTRVREATGLPARAGVAHGKLTSRIVTQYLEQRDTMVLPPGREVLFLGSLSTRYLPLPPPAFEQLRALGITKIHAYGALPRRGILPRFGYAGLRAYDLAHGLDDTRVQPWTAEPFIEARHTFPDPIANTRSLSYRLEQLAREISGPLAERYQLAGELVLTVAFERGEAISRHRTLLEPAGSARVLAGHAEALMAEIGWRAPVERLVLAARGLCIAPARQIALFRQAEEAQAGVESTLARIQARYGEDVVRQGRRAEPDSRLHERRGTTVPWRSAQG